MSLLKFLSTAVLGTLLATVLAKNALAEEDCVPSRWGGGDEIGAANHISAQNTLAAVSLVKQGQSHPLGIVIDPNMPAFPPRQMSLQVVQPQQQYGRDLAENYGWSAIYNDDVAQLWWGIGPQLDGLGHMGEGDAYYNCHKAKDISELTGLTHLGIAKVPPLVGRGVLLNMAAHFGVDALAGGQPISSADIRAAAKAQGVTFRTGDIILLHTGWTDAHLVANPQTWVSSEPGITNEAARYLASLEPMAVGADTWALEAIPAAEGDKMIYGHVILLKHNGIYILETMNTGRLAREGVSEFLFVLGQARVKGAVQMMINPVALW